MEKIPASNKSALVVVDVQKGFINRHTASIPDQILRLLGEVDFRHRIFTKFLNFPNSQYFRLLNWSRFTGSPETDLVDSLSEKYTVLIEKHSYTGLTDKFRQYALAHDIETFYVVGIDTDICVLKTAVDLFESGYRPIVLSEYCMSHAGRNAHEAAMTILPRFIGRQQVITNAIEHFQENSLLLPHYA